MSVGIVGGGIAGLYAALLLQSQGRKVRIFEGTHRVGGRIYTHHFTAEKNQYFEAGAMRIPDTSSTSDDFQKIVFQLVRYINEHAAQDRKIELIPYILSEKGNFVYVNGRRPDGVSAWGPVTPRLIGWDAGSNADKTAFELLNPPIKALRKFRDSLGWDEFVEKFDKYSFRYFLEDVCKYDTNIIDFLETVASQANQFALSCVELLMQMDDFGIDTWKTIDQGMDRLPQAMATIVGLENITFGARVTGIKTTDDSRVAVVAQGDNGVLKSVFDQVILAIPPAALKMIVDRPPWPIDKEMAIRSMHFEALYKIGLRFKTRFWEKVSPGGQSITDLPIRWIIYPSNGIGETGPGVLLLYSWMTDASTWLPLNHNERRSLALQCLDRLYGRGTNVYDELIETFDVTWSSRSATGDAMFLPGQFAARFDPARRPEGNVYFAGEHLSHHHTWIAGALDSALYTVRGILDKPDLQPLHEGQRLPTPGKGESLRCHFSPRSVLFPLGRDVGQGNLQFSSHEHGSSGAGEEESGRWSEAWPASLGGQVGHQTIGPETAYMTGFGSALV